MSFVEFRNVTKFYQMGEQKIAAADGVTVRTVDVPKLQRTLREQGVFFG